MAGIFLKIICIFLYWITLRKRLIGKDSDAGRDWGQEEKGTTEDEMAGWHHWLDGSGSGWTPGVGNGQGNPACCDSWGRKESDTTEQLNWTELNLKYKPQIHNLCYTFPSIQLILCIFSFSTYTSELFSMVYLLCNLLISHRLDAFTLMTQIITMVWSLT